MDHILSVCALLPLDHSLLSFFREILREEKKISARFIFFFSFDGGTTFNRNFLCLPQALCIFVLPSTQCIASSLHIMPLLAWWFAYWFFSSRFFFFAIHIFFLLQAWSWFFLSLTNSKGDWFEDIDIDLSREYLKFQLITVISLKNGHQQQQRKAISNCLEALLPAE